MSNEKLLARAASGDKESAGRLVSENRKFIESEVYGITSKFDFDVIRCEEMVQEGYIAFLGAIHGFDALKGIKFRTYASVCIRNMTEMRTMQRELTMRWTMKRNLGMIGRNSVWKVYGMV